MIFIKEFCLQNLVAPVGLTILQKHFSTQDIPVDESAVLVANNEPGSVFTEIHASYPTTLALLLML